MNITEPVMRPGAFTLELSSTTPGWVRDLINDRVEDRNGYVVQFKTRVTSPTLATARYTGWLTGRADRATLGFSGVGLAALMQADEAIGLYHGDAQTYTSDTLDDFVTAVLHGGLTKGTVTLTGLDTIDIFWEPGIGAREFLDQACRAVGGARWKVTPEGDIDAGPRTSVFVDDPAVLVGNSIGTLSASGLRGITGGISNLVVDATQVSSRSIGYGDFIPAHYTSASSNVAEGINNSNVVLSRIVDLPNSSGTELETLTDANAARFTEHRTSFGLVASPQSHIHDYVQPGDAVYVAAEPSGIRGSTAVLFGDHTLYPIKCYVTAMTWDTEPDNGVWLYADNAWTDLSEYVVHRSKAAVLAVSSDPDDGVPQGNPDRITRSEVSVPSSAESVWVPGGAPAPYDPGNTDRGGIAPPGTTGGGLTIGWDT